MAMVIMPPIRAPWRTTSPALPPMSDLQARFEAAFEASANLSERPDNQTLLKLYALYKQGSLGDNPQAKPGLGDIIGRAKWEAWNKLQGLPQDEAMQQYVDLIDSLA